MTDMFDMQAMQAQNFMWGPTLVTIGMFIANIPINMVLIKAFGFTGAAFAQSVSRIALFLFLVGKKRYSLHSNLLHNLIIGLLGVKELLTMASMCSICLHVWQRLRQV